MARKPLAQQVGTTSDVQMYKPAAGVRVTNGELKVNNNTSNDLTFRVYHDIDGVIYAAANAIVYDEPILANTTKTISIPSMDESGGLAIRASANTSITFTLYGNEVTDPATGILGQVRSAGTTAVSIYSPGTDVTAVNLKLVIANTSGAARTYRVFQDDDGTTYDESTAVAWDLPIAADSRVELKLAPMSDSAGNIAVRHDAANGLTFTLEGSEL